MKKKSKTPIYIPHQDIWSEHLPTPGKLKSLKFEGFDLLREPNSDYNKLLRTQNKLKSKQK